MNSKIELENPLHILVIFTLNNHFLENGHVPVIIKINDYDIDCLENIIVFFTNFVLR